MPLTEANGIQIAYDVFGDQSKPAVLLIAGVTAQLHCWNAEFCNALAGRGFYVIRYDNRDVGLSSKIEGMSASELMGLFGKLLEGKEARVPYGIEDMAADAAGLLDALATPGSTGAGKSRKPTRPVGHYRHGGVVCDHCPMVRRQSAADSHRLALYLFLADSTRDRLRTPACAQRDVGTRAADHLAHQPAHRRAGIALVAAGRARRLRALPSDRVDQPGRYGGR